jgi:hypothetical protein
MASSPQSKAQRGDRYKVSELSDAGRAGSGPMAHMVSRCRVADRHVLGRATFGILVGLTCDSGTAHIPTNSGPQGNDPTRYAAPSSACRHRTTLIIKTIRWFSWALIEILRRGRRMLFRTCQILLSRDRIRHRAAVQQPRYKLQAKAFGMTEFSFRGVSTSPRKGDEGNPSGRHDMSLVSAVVQASVQPRPVDSLG